MEESILISSGKWKKRSAAHVMSTIWVVLRIEVMFCIKEISFVLSCRWCALYQNMCVGVAMEYAEQCYQELIIKYMTFSNINSVFEENCKKKSELFLYFRNNIKQKAFVVWQQI